LSDISRMASRTDASGGMDTTSRPLASSRWQTSFIAPPRLLSVGSGIVALTAAPEGRVLPARRQFLRLIQSANPSGPFLRVYGFLLHVHRDLVMIRRAARCSGKGRGPGPPLT